MYEGRTADATRVAPRWVCAASGTITPLPLATNSAYLPLLENVHSQACLERNGNTERLYQEIEGACMGVEGETQT